MDAMGWQVPLLGHCPAGFQSLMWREEVRSSQNNQTLDTRVPRMCLSLMAVRRYTRVVKNKTRGTHNGSIPLMSSYLHTNRLHSVDAEFQPNARQDTCRKIQKVMWACIRVLSRGRLVLWLGGFHLGKRYCVRSPFPQSTSRHPLARKPLSYLLLHDPYLKICWVSL